MLIIKEKLIIINLNSKGNNNNRILDKNYNKINQIPSP